MVNRLDTFVGMASLITFQKYTHVEHDPLNFTISHPVSMAEIVCIFVSCLISEINHKYFTKLGDIAEHAFK